MAAKRKVREITKIRRQDILTAAEKLFSQKGFNGTTTKDLATPRGRPRGRPVSVLQEQARTVSRDDRTELARNRPTALKQMEQAAADRDDRAFFEALAIGLLTRFEEDPSIPRLILRSALDGHEPPNVALERQLRVEQPTLQYIAKRTREGAFRKINPRHGVYAFGAMLFGYIVRQQILGMAKHRKHDRKKVAEDFVTIFLDGIRK
jgi:TetR/AcrR family transcriptional regulator